MKDAAGTVGSWEADPSSGMIDQFPITKAWLLEDLRIMRFAGRKITSTVPTTVDTDSQALSSISTGFPWQRWRSSVTKERCVLSPS